MTSCALTLIGNAETAPLQEAHIELVRRRLDRHADGTVRVDWLAEGEACDLLFDSTLAVGEIAKQAGQDLSATAIDAACTVADSRRKKLLISDMDSTVIEQECIDELGDAFGVGDQIREITATVIRGDITFPEALHQRMALMKGMPYNLLESVYKERLTLMPGARTMVQTMRQAGAYCILVSGGFTFFTGRIAKRIGFDDHRGNELLFAETKLTGKVKEPILGRTAKQETLNALCQEKSLRPDQVLAVGDGANDIKMIKAAGLGIAMHGSDLLKRQADACIEHGDLTAVLYIQGYRKAEFVLT